MALTIEPQGKYEEVSQWLSSQIVAFNKRHWGTVEKQPIAITYRDAKQTIVGGASGQAFGNWLMLERLWIDDSLRGQGIGAELLNAIEQQALCLGCQYVMVDTLDFQAKPFYVKHGYTEQFQQGHYPINGYRSYLTKIL